MKSRAMRRASVSVILAIAGLWTIFGKPTMENQRSVLEESDHFILYSLHAGSTWKEDVAKLKGKEKFYGYPVWGKIEITDEGVKQKLVAALYQGVAEKSGEGLCFWPRHGVRAVNGIRSVDMVICFECLQIDMYANYRKNHILTSNSPRQLFSRVLRDANIEMDRTPLNNP